MIADGLAKCEDRLDRKNVENRQVCDYFKD